jgi:hypothetical protein
MRGVSRSSRCTLGTGLRWTLWRQACESASDENAEAYGQVVWSWRRDAGAKLVERSAGDGDNKPAHRGEYEVRRNTIAQGMSVCSPLTCMLVCAFSLCAMHTRPRVQRAPGIPCALCSPGGTTNLQSSGETRRENEDVCLSTSLRAKRSNPALL